MNYKPPERMFNKEEVTHIIIKFALPYCLYLKNDNLVVVIDGKPAYITHEIIHADSIRGGTANVKIPEVSRVIFDRWGRKEITNISVSLPKHSWPENYDPIADHGNIIAKYSLQYVNKLITCYKLVTNEYLCSEIVDIDLIEYTHMLLNSNNKTCVSSTCMFSFNKLASGPDLTFSNDTQHNRIKELAQNSNSIPVWDELALKANAETLTSNFGLAIFFAALSFESFCKHIIRTNYLNQKKKNIEEIDILFEKCPFPTLLSDHLKNVINFDFGSTEEFSNWKKDVHLLRNKIAHGQETTFSKKDTNKAFEVLTKARNTILEHTTYL